MIYASSNILFNLGICNNVNERVYREVEVGSWTQKEWASFAKSENGNRCISFKNEN